VSSQRRVSLSRITGITPGLRRRWSIATMRNCCQIDRVVRAAVDDELQRQGFTRVENNAADAHWIIDIASHMDVSHAGSNSPLDDAARAMDSQSQIAPPIRRFTIIRHCHTSSVSSS